MTVNATNTLASSEPGEPSLGSGQSLWWTWTAPHDGVATLSFLDPSFASAMVGVYAGNSLTNLTLLSSGNGASFAARAGATYQIAVDGPNGSSGSFLLQLSLGPTVRNDNFANRTLLTGASGTIAAYNYTATTEPGEPNFGLATPVQKTVWWSWTAPANGHLILDISGSFDWVLGVFTNATLSTLQRVALTPAFSPPGAMLLAVRAGQTYQLGVGSRDGSEGAFTLSYTLADDGNDNFADRIVLVGENASGTADNTYATSEPGEPNHGGSSTGRSVWWSWSAPRTMRVALDSGNGSVLAVYMGDSLTNLSCVASNVWLGQLYFDAVAGVTYQIAVDTAWASFAVVGSLTLSPAPVTPPNDFFANRALLSGTNASGSGYAAEATSEPDEPLIGSGNTLWWTWTAPGNGRAYLGFGANCASQVFTGDELTNLTLIASNPLGNGLSFLAVSNVTYQISIDSVPTYLLQTASLTLTLLDAPVNDNFSGALWLTGAPVATNASSSSATQEPGEPVFAGTNRAASLWWKWTAPATQRMTLFTSGQMEDFWAQGFTTCFGVYTGEALTNLISIKGG